jgi:SAM-dependent methyltransferase
MVPTKTYATVEYVDVLSNEMLESRYGLPASHLVPLAHVIDGNNLSVYRDGELDFLIANHVLEHFDDPVGGLIEWLRILKPGGRLFITLPNHRSNCYDWQRIPARAEHLELDYSDPSGRPARNLKHYEDFAQAINQWPDGDPNIHRQAMEWTEANDRHHYHVYDEQTVVDVLTLAARHAGCGLRFIGGLLPAQGFEFLMVVEKTEGQDFAGWPSRWLRELAAGCHLTTAMALEGWRNVRRRQD